MDNTGVMGKYVTNNGAAWADSMLLKTAYWNGSSWVQLKEGDFYHNGTEWIPILRDPSPSMYARVSGSNMILTFGYNHTLKVNPVIVIIGSSHGMSLNLSGADTMQYKLQQLANTNWSGATIINLSVPGEYTDHWLPTAMGGLPDRNIDAALAYNPDFIFIVGPTNDAVQNTPAEATANLQVIVDYAKCPVFIHSPLLRGDYNADQIANLQEENQMWPGINPYRFIPLFDVLNDPFGPMFQSDHIHLSPAGTTVQANAMFAVADADLRPNTAYLNFEVERSDSELTGYSLFDTIADPQIIRKIYAKQAGYYRARAMLKNGAYTAYSNVIHIANSQALLFNFSATEQDIPGYANLHGQPHQAVITDTLNGITVSTVSTTVWSPFGSTANDVNGQADNAGQTFRFSVTATRSYMFNYSTTYTPGNENILISGFTPGEVIPLIEVLGSRDSSGVSFATRLCDYTLVDANGPHLVHDFNVKGNTNNVASWANMVADSNGQIKLAVYRRSPVDPNHEIGYINVMSITRNV